MEHKITLGLSGNSQIFYFQATEAQSPRLRPSKPPKIRIYVISFG